MTENLSTAPDYRPERIPLNYVSYCTSATGDLPDAATGGRERRMQAEAEESNRQTDGRPIGC